MAPYTSLRRQGSDCKRDLNLSPGPREVSGAGGKPRDTTTKAEGVPSETVVTEFPLSFPSLSFVTLCTTLAEGETGIRVSFVQF